MNIPPALDQRACAKRVRLKVRGSIDEVAFEENNRGRNLVAPQIRCVLRALLWLWFRGSARGKREYGDSF